MNARHFTAFAPRGEMLAPAQHTVARECLARLWTCALLRAVDGGFGSGPTKLTVSITSPLSG
jgi:hypothetical protein